jgi:indolepyruvate ferredoxin oxidoreductase
MAHKDEWEVARLYARPEFREELARTFEGDFSLRFHVAGGPFGKRDPATGKLIKREVGPWLMTAFRLMAPLRGLRGSMLDPFRNSSERKLAAELLARYEADIAQVLDGLNSHTHANAVKLLSLPDKVRGYGHVREAHAQRMEVERAALLAPADSPRQVIEVRRSATA